MSFSKPLILPFIGVLIVLSAAARAESASPPRRCVDVDGQPLALFGGDVKPSVLVFLGMECPISNQYVPILNQLAARNRDAGVRFFAVVCDSSSSRRDVRAYRDATKFAFPVIFDASALWRNR